MQRALLLLAATLVTVTLFSGVANASTLALGNFHGCGVRTDATLACWGRTFEGQINAPVGTFTAVSAGAFSDTSCGLRTDGTLACWGQNGSGQASPPAGTFTAVSSANHHGCAVRTDGTVACWGGNTSGQASPPGGTFTTIASGWLHSCGVRTDGTVACWGTPNFGQTAPPAGTFTDVGTGEWHSCGLRTDGTLACWGDNSQGQSTPPGGTFTSLSVGAEHNCAVRTDKTAACWGRNGDGQATAPANIAFKQVAAGWRLSCGVRPNGGAVCWGRTRSASTGRPRWRSPIRRRPTTAPRRRSRRTSPGRWVRTAGTRATSRSPGTSRSPSRRRRSVRAAAIRRRSPRTPPRARVTCEAGSFGGNASQSVTVKRDATAPTITIDAPDYECEDDGAGVEECEGVTSDNAPGSRTLTVTATDRAGNEATQSVTYTVPVPVTPVTTPTGGGTKPATGATSTPQPVAPPSVVARLRAGRVSLFGRAAARTRCVVEHGAITECRARLSAGGRRIAVGRAGGESAQTVGVRLRLTRYGKALLERRLGGVRATLQLRSGSLRATARTRAMLRVEHATTPPGAWTAGATTLSARGERFVQRLRGKLVRVAALRCDGHAADRAPGLSSVRISEARAATLCAALGISAPRTVVGHGDTQPIASNASEAGRATNRRVELTIAHRRVRGR